MLGLSLRGRHLRPKLHSVRRRYVVERAGLRSLQRHALSGRVLRSSGLNKLCAGHVHSVPVRHLEQRCWRVFVRWWRRLQPWLLRRHRPHCPRQRLHCVLARNIFVDSWLRDLHDVCCGSIYVIGGPVFVHGFRLHRWLLRACWARIKRGLRALSVGHMVSGSSNSLHRNAMCRGQRWAYRVRDRRGSHVCSVRVRNVLGRGRRGLLRGKPLSRRFHWPHWPYKCCCGDVHSVPLRAFPGRKRHFSMQCRHHWRTVSGRHLRSHWTNERCCFNVLAVRFRHVHIVVRPRRVCRDALRAGLLRNSRVNVRQRLLNVPLWPLHFIHGPDLVRWVHLPARQCRPPGVNERFGSDLQCLPLGKVHQLRGCFSLHWHRVSCGLLWPDERQRQHASIVFALPIRNLYKCDGPRRVLRNPLSPGLVRVRSVNYG